MEFPCPLPATLTDIPASGCDIAFDQIVKLAFQKAGTPFASTTTIRTLATWTGLKAADDDTKVVVTPILWNLVIPESEAQTEGGNDNTTPYGLPLYKGESTVTVTAQLRGLSDEQTVALDDLVAQSRAALGSEVVVFFIDRYGRIISKGLTGFDIYNFRKSSVGSAGLNAPNTYGISFTLPERWDKGFVVNVPTDFKADKAL